VAEKSSSTRRRTPTVQKSWIATLVSLVVGLGVGTTLGRSVLDSAGIPASCVRTINRAERAIDTGTVVADDGKAALQAVKDLRIGDAGNLLAEVKQNASRLLDEASRFNTARQRCQADRK